MDVDLIGNRTLRDLLEERASLYGHRPALVFEDRDGQISQWSYREFDDQVNRTAGAFHRLGVCKGEKVTVHLRNCPEFLFAWLALAKLGAVTVPSNVANTASEFEHVVGWSDSVGVITQPDYLPVVRSVLGRCSGARFVIVARAQDAVEGTHRFDELVVRSGSPPARTPLESMDDMEIVFTSGTTSRPKGVVLTHANALHSGERVCRHMGLGPDDRNLTALPMFHCNAQSITALSALTAGAAIVLMETYSATKFWDQIRRHRATMTSIVPALLRTILAQPPRDTDRDHSLRVTFYAINVTDREKEEFERRFGVELINGYGLSEAMTEVTLAPRVGPKRWPSVGLPAQERIVKIVREDGTDAAVGEVGEIATKGIPGRTIMKGYYKDPEATANAVVDGWLHTGDSAYLDENGYVYFVDRKKDMIKRGAENVSASEVERVLMEHPDVIEAAVVGVPDPIYDEAVKAFIVLQRGALRTEEELIAHCRQHLAKFKVPSFVAIRESLPKTSIGKIEKKALRAE